MEYDYSDINNPQKNLRLDIAVIHARTRLELVHIIVSAAGEYIEVLGRLQFSD